MIIGMDWLEKNKVILNYYEKSFVYKELESQFFVRQISTMQFNKCISKGFKVYVIQVTNMLERERIPSLEDYAVLQRFKDVFVEEIPKLPPRREIDFSIDILSGSTPIPKEPYRMSLPKLTGLKIQL
jgi:hypothetical protein